ncbi:hypothetical protein HPP92_006015 [Vanilla planifolia]|uniref:Agenet domain-containing protein n=1 Tax=Vanilla planifolia TaxID=51239 RepID=A0A835RRA7_VANPL|nr:hypothetical protein HPP92_006343 [Vanilla planifolia]KAG0495021.1 hypothetical protein HPP92_006015 [Vanilla planifolia]
MRKTRKLADLGRNRLLNPTGFGCSSNIWRARRRRRERLLGRFVEDSITKRFWPSKLVGSVAEMDFKKGTKVEVLEKGYTSFGSWRPARILSGNDHSYAVKYDGCSMETTMLFKEVPRKMLRPVPPPVGLKSLACGDVVEVLDDGSWKLAQVMKLHGRSTVIMELMGSSNLTVSPLDKLRMARIWKDNHWISFEKESLKSEDVHVNKQSKGGRLSNQISLSTTGKQTSAQLNRFAENYGDQDYIGRTSKKLRLSFPPVYEHAKVCREKKELKKKAKVTRVNKQSVTHQLLEKVDGVDSPDCFYGNKHVNTDLNHDLSRLCPIGIKCKRPKADEGSNLQMGLEHFDNGSTASSVGSCSINDAPNKLVCHKSSGRHELNNNFNGSGFCCGSPGKQSCLAKVAIPEAIHSLELDAYRSTLRLFYAYAANPQGNCLIAGLQLMNSILEGWLPEHLICCIHGMWMPAARSFTSAGDVKMMSGGGYTTIDNQKVSGSVPAVSGPDHVAVKFTESTLQTFPPSEAKGKITGGYRPPTDADDTFSKPAIGNSNESQQSGWMRTFTVASYKAYFDVDTSDVLERIRESLIPFKTSFTELTANNPDLYGPFWICTTLIFAAASIGTFVTYLAHKFQKKEWDYDINLVTWSAGLFYGYVTLVPLGLYIILKYFSAPMGLIQLWCLYGYSLFIFIPALCLSIVPIEIFRWVIVGVAGFMSACFVALNLRSHISSAGERWFLIVVGIFLLQLGLAAVLKLFFFTVTV